MPADPARVALAHQLLAQLGVSVADLHATQDSDVSGRSAVVVPTIAEYLPRVIAAAGPGAPHLRVLLDPDGHSLGCAAGGHEAQPGTQTVLDYSYDFGDDWEDRVSVQAVTVADSDSRRAHLGRPPALTRRGTRASFSSGTPTIHIPHLWISTISV